MSGGILSCCTIKVYGLPVRVDIRRLEEGANALFSSGWNVCVPLRRDASSLFADSESCSRAVVDVGVLRCER